MRWWIPAALAAALAPAPALAHPTGDAKSTPQGDGSYGFSFGVTRGRLGVELTSMTKELRRFFGAPADRGVLVSRVEPKSAAARAGVKVGDVIVSVDGDAVDGGFDVLHALAGKKKGDRVDLTVVRNKRRVHLTAVIDEEGGSFGRWFDFSFQTPSGRFLDPFDGSWEKKLEWHWPKDPWQNRDRLERRMRKLEKEMERMRKRLRRRHRTST